MQSMDSKRVATSRTRRGCMIERNTKTQSNFRRRSRRGRADALAGPGRCLTMAILSHHGSRGYGTGSAARWVRTWLTAAIELDTWGLILEGAARWVRTWLTAERPAHPPTGRGAARWVRTWLTAEFDRLQQAEYLAWEGAARWVRTWLTAESPLRRPGREVLVMQGGLEQGSLRSGC